MALMNFSTILSWKTLASVFLENAGDLTRFWRIHLPIRTTNMLLICSYLTVLKIRNTEVTGSRRIWRCILNEASPT